MATQSFRFIFLQLSSYLQYQEFSSPLVCYSSVRLPEGGVGNPPAEKGQAYERQEQILLLWWKQQGSEVYHRILDEVEALPWYQVFS